MGHVPFWHQVAIILGGPVAMSLASVALARLLEEGAGPVIPPLDEPGTRRADEGGYKGGSGGKNAGGGRASPQGGKLQATDLFIDFA